MRLKMNRICIEELEVYDEFAQVKGYLPKKMIEFWDKDDLKLEQYDKDSFVHIQLTKYVPCLVFWELDRENDASLPAPSLAISGIITLKDDKIVNFFKTLVPSDEDEFLELNEETKEMLKNRMEEVKKGNVISSEEMVKRLNEREIPQCPKCKSGKLNIFVEADTVEVRGLCKDCRHLWTV